MKVSVAMDYPLAMEKADPGNLILEEAQRMLKGQAGRQAWAEEPVIISTLFLLE